MDNAKAPQNKRAILLFILQWPEMNCTVSVALKLVVLQFFFSINIDDIDRWIYFTEGTKRLILHKKQKTN